MKNEINKTLEVITMKLILRKKLTKNEEKILKILEEIVYEAERERKNEK